MSFEHDIAWLYLLLSHCMLGNPLPCTPNNKGTLPFCLLCSSLSLASRQLNCTDTTNWGRFVYWLSPSLHLVFRSIGNLDEADLSNMLPDEYEDGAGHNQLNIDELLTGLNTGGLTALPTPTGTIPKPWCNRRSDLWGIHILDPDPDQDLELKTVNGQDAVHSCLLVN